MMSKGVHSFTAEVVLLGPQSKKKYKLNGLKTTSKNMARTGYVDFRNLLTATCSRLCSNS